ncbi:hypothetical protein KPH14_006331 [Odynerus spinipes]|uniref:Uncharacterized protein n=1 Tax=Odynerus spinipes TaxID=1348599 RepID=A0AAD9RZ03_9HYME|nr:hypothetical protein KPH14_006331 [Odynerus spinipes]
MLENRLARHTYTSSGDDQTRRSTGETSDWMLPDLVGDQIEIVTSIEFTRLRRTAESVVGVVDLHAIWSSVRVTGGHRDYMTFVLFVNL